METLETVSATTSVRKRPRWLYVTALFAIVGLAISFALGRVTAPLHGHPIPAPRSAGLSLDARCSEVTRDLGGAGVGTLDAVEVDLSYRSGWPPGSASGQPNFGMALDPSSGPWVFSHPASERSSTGPSWFGFGGGAPNDAPQQAARRWLQARAAEPDWEPEPSSPPGDFVGDFYARDVQGTFVFEYFDVAGGAPLGPLHLRLAVFDVDGSMIERELVHPC